ncbi:hypothetical protein [Hymenobacter latericus]|uniref:hypothetical protein n=1 Tax=Hymenobacter sp. YIM 151858-1 TaxID=2987688 RepID=UPI00222648E9|nr:hypothetical protein [Hymenobacter sp. YIM 151858-1]UYZ58928.1 hypothetical protein OIS50_17945 [Hymenobacter sp. YIM 151858-1]
MLAVLSGKYDEAYRLLAPEVQAGVSPARFRTAAEPIYRQGQQRGARIDLYRLGLRIGDDDQVRWFYAFSFKSDSLVKVPQQLDVTFRDSAATGVLEFRMVPAAADGPSARPR